MVHERRIVSGAFVGLCQFLLRCRQMRYLGTNESLTVRQGSGSKQVMRGGPFAGALVPCRFHRRDNRVHAIMIEVNRGNYFNEGSGAPSADFEVTAHCLRQALGRLIELYDERRKISETDDM